MSSRRVRGIWVRLKGLIYQQTSAGMTAHDTFLQEVSREKKKNNLKSPSRILKKTRSKMTSTQNVFRTLQEGYFYNVTPYPIETLMEHVPIMLL